MNKAILNNDVQEYIRKNINLDIVRVSLGKSPFPDISPKELAMQIDSKRRCEDKIPLWYHTPGIYYPEKLAIEQCSSELAAKYKSKLVLGKVIDLTGGFGVDAGFFSKHAEHVTHCEINNNLSEISAYNSKILGFPINHVNTDGMEYLSSSKETYDTIYLDPSRRVGSHKVFLLKDCEPNVVENRALLFEKSPRVLIKTGPLLDLHSTIKELGSVAEIHVVSIKNECKEVLYLLDRMSTEIDPPITCAILDQDQPLTFAFRLSQERAFTLYEYSKPLKYLYEPDVSLLKAGCFKLITKHFTVKKIQQHTHLYTSDILEEEFMGRKFEVQNTWNFGSFIKNPAIKKANIICRNFPQDPEKIRKKLKINDGGADYLLFCTGPENELLVIHCHRIK